MAGAPVRRRRWQPSICRTGDRRQPTAAGQRPEPCRSVAALMEALKPALTGEVLINSLDAGNTGPDLTRAAYSEKHYRKLVALKDKYDPDNVFRFNHNIAPSKGAAKT